MKNKDENFKSEANAERKKVTKNTGETISLHVS